MGYDWEILPGEAAPIKEAKLVARRTGDSWGILMDLDGFTAIG